MDYQGYFILSKNQDGEYLPNRHIFMLTFHDVNPSDSNFELQLDGFSWCGQIKTSVQLIKDEGPTLYLINKDKLALSSPRWERSDLTSLQSLDELHKRLAQGRMGDFCEDCLRIFAK